MKKEIAQRAFLAAYAVTASVKRAAETAKIDRQQHYRWMRADAEYPAKFAAAEEEAAQALEDEAVERGMHGYYEPVIYQGQQCYELKEVPHPDPELAATGATLAVQDLSKPLRIPKWDGRLLELLLKRFRPEKYRDNAKVEHTGAGGAPLTINVRFVKPGEQTG